MADSSDWRISHIAGRVETSKRRITPAPSEDEDTDFSTSPAVSPSVQGGFGRDSKQKWIQK